jgi:COP9 signalosome complex subunit 1
VVPQVPTDLGGSYNEVLTSRDVAVYGALCSLACFERRVLRERVIQNIAFHEFLEGHLEVRVEFVNPFFQA